MAEEAFARGEVLTGAEASAESSELRELQQSLRATRDRVAELELKAREKLEASHSEGGTAAESPEIRGGRVAVDEGNHPASRREPPPSSLTLERFKKGDWDTR